MLSAVSGMVNPILSRYLVSLISLLRSGWKLTNTLPSESFLRMVCFKLCIAEASTDSLHLWKSSFS